jgi:hypothetical protein
MVRDRDSIYNVSINNPDPSSNSNSNFNPNPNSNPEQCSNLINSAENSQSLGGLGLSQTMSGSKKASTRTSSTCYLPNESVRDVLTLTELLTGNDKNSNHDAVNDNL